MASLRFTPGTPEQPTTEASTPLLNPASPLQGNRMAVSVFFDKYKDQAVGLEAIRGDAENIKRVLEDKLSSKSLSLRIKLNQAR